VIEALQALGGVALVAAVTVEAEVGELARFATPRQLMGYSGAVASEASTGQRTRLGASRKRATRISGASSSRRPGRPGIARRWVRPSRNARPPSVHDVNAIAWKAQHRLHGRYRALMARGKCKQRVVTAIGRELLGFIWAIGIHVESRTADGSPVAA
jgi:hypothetical protein